MRIITDFTNEFYPCPKPGKRPKITDENRQKQPKIDKKEKDEFCIMPQSTKYSTKRTEKYCERHEVFFGQAYRQKSINDGLIVFLTIDDHRGTNGVHGKKGDKLNKFLKKKGQEAWMKYYNKTEEDFIKRYGKSFI